MACLFQWGDVCLSERLRSVFHIHRIPRCNQRSQIEKLTGFLLANTLPSRKIAFLTAFSGIEFP
jgi:hypothetical protein